jgi:hypothetical protein
VSVYDQIYWLETWQATYNESNVNDLTFWEVCHYDNVTQYNDTCLLYDCSTGVYSPKDNLNSIIVKTTRKKVVNAIAFDVASIAGSFVAYLLLYIVIPLLEKSGGIGHGIAFLAEHHHDHDHEDHGHDGHAHEHGEDHPVGGDDELQSGTMDINGASSAKNLNPHHSYRMSSGVADL